MATKKSAATSDPSVVGDKVAQIEERRRRREEATTVDGSESFPAEEAAPPNA